MRAAGKRVDSESGSGSDITDQFYDEAARLRNTQAAHTRLLELMKLTGSVPEILEVQRELTRVTEQMEVSAGRKQRMQRDVQMATVTVTLNEEQPPRPRDPSSVFNPGETFRRAIEVCGSIPVPRAC